MRLLLAIALILLFLWFHKAQTSNDDALHASSCKAVSMGEAAVSLLLSPLSLYSWMTSTLLRLVLSAPALVLSSLYHTLLLFLAGPWCAATVCISLLLSCLRVALYLLHLVLVVGVVAILALTQHKMADGDAASDKVLYQQKTLERHRAVTRLRMFVHRVAHEE